MSGHPSAATDERDAQIEEHDCVRLTRAATSDEGRVLEAGSRGTVVSIYGRGEAFCIEFTGVTPALATVGSDAIEPIPEETRDRLAAKPVLR